MSGTSLAVQWLRLCAFAAGGTGLTKIPHAMWQKKKKKKKKKKKECIPSDSSGQIPKVNSKGKESKSLFTTVPHPTPHIRYHLAFLKNCKF